MIIIFVKSYFILTICSSLYSRPKEIFYNYLETKKCDNGALSEEIASYKPVVENIIKYVVNGPFQKKTYDELCKFVDKFGSRITGSTNLENSIDYILNLTKEENLNDTITEELQVPYWVRGEENITMLQPRLKNIAVLGLGTSISTPPEGITAEVLMVKNFSELSRIPEKVVKGKIVLYDPIFTTYSDTVQYRVDGANQASLKGAVASLVRSITPFSINSPHTGGQIYKSNITKIPTAAIAIEDADLIRRLYDRKQKIVLCIKLFSTQSPKTSRNTIIDLKGTDKSEKLVIVSGHIDSWDVGQGAMDDGGGFFISWAVPVILKRLNLSPKRTIRSILWTAEELGLVGAYAYKEAHKNDSNNINFIMESDAGTFAPLGLEVGGTQKARCIIAEILQLFKSINASALIETDAPGSDITIFTGDGIPGAMLYNADDKYFWFHHTEGDTMNVENPLELDLCTAFWTAVSYVIANITIDIPR